MIKRSNVILGWLALFLALLACASPLGGNGTAPQNVETIVAATFQALTAPAPNNPPPSTGGLLPHSMYFLNNDAAGIVQVYRLERDGVTVKQITFEPSTVSGYDVSPVDGSVAYVSNNQLLNIRADGSNRALLVDGGPVDQNNPFLASVSKPVWSPNGQTIAFSQKGLSFYSIISGQSNRVLDNLINSSNGFQIPNEIYSPDKYSPDGSKLFITIGHYEGASAAIYYPNGNALVRLKGDEGAMICCGRANWSLDNTSLFVGNPYMGMFISGLWKVNAADGQTTTLIKGDADPNTWQFADAPYHGSDGNLYFFYGSQPAAAGVVNRVPLQLVKSAADGVTNRTVIRSDAFNLMNEALWAPDGRFVIVAMAPIQDVYQGGAAELYYTDGQKAMVPLVPFAMDMRWGP